MFGRSTNGLLCPQTGGWGERPARFSQSESRDQKTGKLIPFTFSGMYARCFYSQHRAKPVSREDLSGKYFRPKKRIEARPLKITLPFQLPDTPKDEALGIDLREFPKNPNYLKRDTRGIADGSWGITLTSLGFLTF